VSSGDGSGQIPVCVLGFGRSGTSLTVRLLNLLGMSVGPEEDLLAPADADNPRGYWEPRWVIELNDELLARLGTVWQQPFPLAPGWERSPELDDLRERARGLLEEKFGSASLWGWKDPRLMLTLPFWRELVPNARYVLCLRNPADVISSYQRRPEPNLTIEEWGDLWLEFNARALQETREEPRLVVFYEDLFRTGREQVTRMAAFLGLEAPADDERFWAPLLEEIEPELRHHSTSALELSGAAAIPPGARALFLALRAAEDARRADSARDDHTSGVSAAVERVAPELWYERRLLAEARAAGEQAAGQLAELAGEREGLGEELDGARTELGALRGELEGTRAELSRSTDELRRSATLNSESQAELGSLRDRLARQQMVIDGLQASLSWRLTAPLRWVKRRFRGG
jgi:hypothetical protein